MAPPVSATMSLRAITTRLMATPVDSLPYIVPQLATALLDCTSILSLPTISGKERSENSILVHKLKTRISSLLQDRSCEGRWSAVVLVKAVIELGGWEILRTSEPWVRSMINILGRPDPPTTKKLVILCITRIFLLTQKYPTLIREITTPFLPAFITACLNLISTPSTDGTKRELKSNSTVLEIVLGSLKSLVSKHPTVFRSFAGQIHSLTLPLLAPTSTYQKLYPISGNVKDVAQGLFVALHHCAPKNTSGNEWASAFQTSIASAHSTADRVFRAAVEELALPASVGHGHKEVTDFNQVVSDEGTDPLGMPAWTGIDEGIERLNGTLDLICNFVTQPTAPNVSFAVGALLDLTGRMAAMTVAHGLSTNPQIGRDEREALFSALPSIHVSTMTILFSLVERLQHGIHSTAFTIIEQIIWIYEAESFNRSIRMSTYTILSMLLQYVGPDIPKKTTKALSSVIKTCCKDILPPNGRTSVVDEKSTDSTPKAQKDPSSSTANADDFFTNENSPQSQLSPASSPTYSYLVDAAFAFLTAILTYVPSRFFTPSLRSEIDRVCILTSNKATMLASVLHPPPAKPGAKIPPPSILPFLSRAYPDHAEVEALVRPRMPILFTGISSSGADLTDDTTEIEAGSIINGAGEEEEDDDELMQSDPEPPSPQEGPNNQRPLPLKLVMNNNPQISTHDSSTKSSFSDDLLLSAGLSSPGLAHGPSIDAMLKRAALAGDPAPSSKRLRLEQDNLDLPPPALPSLMPMPPVEPVPTSAISIPQSSRMVKRGDSLPLAPQSRPSTDVVMGNIGIGTTAETGRNSPEGKGKGVDREGPGVDAGDRDDGGNDSDDSEMPPLNVEPDTDEE